MDEHCKPTSRCCIFMLSKKTLGWETFRAGMSDCHLVALGALVAFEDAQETGM